MLNPKHNRFDYGEQLNAPEGFELDCAVATTYSLDLDALLAVSVALGFKDTLEGDLRGEKLVILEAIIRLQDKLKVFYQQGKIKLPTEYNYLFTLLEPCLSSVVPEGGEFSSFHPKLWLLRYKESNKKRNAEIKYRLIVLTRNLTFDRSWDIAASLDGKVMKNIQTKNQAGSWIDFFLSLLENEKEFTPYKQLKKELSYVKWSISYGWSPKLLPGGNRFRQPLALNQIDKIMVISPFLKDAGNQVYALDRLSDAVATDGKKLLFSRAEELNAIGEKKLTNWECYAINPSIVEGAERVEEGIEPHNLHAKMIVTQRVDITDWHIGSANVTSAALGSVKNNTPRNTEFMLKFSDYSHKIGADILMDQLVGEDGAGLFIKHKFETYEEDLNTKEKEKLRSIIFKLIDAKWKLNATLDKESQKYTLKLTFESQALKEVLQDSDITIQADQLAIPNAKRLLSSDMSWQNIELTKISAFIPILIHFNELDKPKTIMIQVDLEIEGGDIRQQGVLKKLFDNKDKVLNYIRMLLNPHGDKNEWLSHDSNRNRNNTGDIDIFATKVPLFEQLMLTASRHNMALTRIGKLIEKLEESDVEIPSEFQALWEHFKKEIKPHA